MRGRLACAVLVLLPSIAAADGGGSLVVADPKGALGDQASVAGGVSGHYALPLGSPFFSLRLEGSALLYGTETIHLPVVGTAGRINREITTDNWIVQAGAGPQVVFPTGRVRPYIHGFAGVSYMSTDSHLRDPYGFVSAYSTNYDDTGFSWGGGGGLLIPLHGGGKSIDLGVRYVRTESMRFLAEGDLGADGVAVPHRGHADVLEFHVGFVVGERPR